MNRLSQRLEKVYELLNVYSYDVLYIYADLRAYALEFAGGMTRHSFLDSFLEPIRARGKTIVMPTFTYTTNGIFDTALTKTRLGALNQHMVRLSNAERSEHPLFSYGGIGPLSSSILTDIGKSAFGFNSVFERLMHYNCGFLHIGRPLESGNTIIHSIEQSGGAVYRFNKVFPTFSYRRGQLVGGSYTAFVKRRVDSGQGFNFSFERSAQSLRSSGIVRQCDFGAGLTSVCCYSMLNAREILCREFEKDHTFFLEPGVTLTNIE